MAIDGAIDVIDAINGNSFRRCQFAWETLAPSADSESPLPGSVSHPAN